MTRRTRISALLTVLLAGVTTTQILRGRAAEGTIGPREAALDSQGKEVAQRQMRQYRYKGVISGSVRLPNGTPVAGLLVRARFQFHQTGAPGEGTAITDSQGNYRIEGLNPQGFFVFVENLDKPFLVDKPRLILLNEEPKEAKTHLDFTVVRGPEITVRVRDAQTGEPVAGVKVTASLPGMGSGNPPGITGDDGIWKFQARYWDTAIRFDFYDRPGRTPIEMAPGKENGSFQQVKFDSPEAVRDVVLDVKTYTSGPKLHQVVMQGTVTGPDNKPVPGAIVFMHRFGSGEALRAITNSKGKFAIRTYRMALVEAGNWDGQDKKGIRLDVEKGDLRATHFATPEETWSTIPVSLKPAEWSSVTGQVVDEKGVPIAGVPIHYSESTQDGAHALPNSAPSGPDGRFTIPHLRGDARYQFRFGKPAHNGNDFGFGETVFPSDPQKPFVPFDFTSLQLKPGENRDLGKITVLRSDAALAGKLVAASGGVPKGPLTVVIRGRHTSASTYPDSEGRFRFPAVVREPITLAVYRADADDPRFFRTGPELPGVAEKRIVQGGDESLEIRVAR